MKWAVVVPAWGERCVRALESVTLAATRRSANQCGAELCFIIHTDQPHRVAKCLQDVEVTFYPVPPGSEPHGKLGNAHRQALRTARPGECLAFINADMVCSTELFSVAERHFSAGKRLIMINGTRTIGAVAPAGMNSAALLQWGMDHAHPSTTECFWDSGRSTTTSTIFFRSGNNVVLHAFHLHPFAIVIERPVTFRGVTIDADLPDSYQRRDIHVITSADEASFAEMSPPERVFRLGSEPMNVDTVLRWAHKGVTSPLHLWFFKHPIAIVGDGSDIGDRDVCDVIYRKVAGANRLL